MLETKCGIHQHSAMLIFSLVSNVDIVIKKKIHSNSNLRCQLHISSCGRQKGPSMMTRYAHSYSLQKGPSLEDSVE